MKKWISRFVWIPPALVFVAFLVANRQPVAVSFDPFSQSAPALATPPFPLWVWLMAAIFLGVLAGAAGLWASTRAARRKARDEHRELKALKKEQARALQEAAATAPGETLPSLRHHEDGLGG